jgi:hypothetical protein
MKLSISGSAAAICLIAIGLDAYMAMAADAPDRVRTIRVPGGGQAVAARVDAKGMIHLLFDSSGGPQYARSTDGGRSFSKALPVVDEGARQPGLEFHVWDMAVGQGRVHVALGTNAWKLKLPKEEWGCYYASLERDAKAFSPLRNINRHPSEGFSLAADEQGKVTACWLSGKLHANLSSDGGRTFGESVEIDPACDPCDCCTTSCTYAADGTLAVLYREETDNSRDMYLLLWDQVKGRTSRTRVSSTLWKIDSCPMTYYAVTRCGAGFAAAWPTENRIYLARLDAAGSLLSPAEIKTPGISTMRSGIVALSAQDGSTLVAWKKDDRLGWQLYDAKGLPVGMAGSAESRGKGAAGVVTADGEFILFR